MANKVEVKANKLASGATIVAYSASRYAGLVTFVGTVMFDANGHYIDATRTMSDGPDDLPAGVYRAARAALEN